MAELYSIDSLSFSRRSTEILKGISFSIEEGEYVSIIGPNGAGKTTLLRHLNRIIRPQKDKTVLLRSKPIEEYDQKEIARTVSYVPQTPTHIQHFSVKEFILMGRYPYLGPFASPTSKDDAAVTESMEQTLTSEFADRDMVTLSGGELQKVFIAAGLAQGGDVILLDEPATFLDPRHQHEIFNILKSIHNEGRTVVMVTHDINTAVLSASRIIAMKDGGIVFDGGSDELMKNEVLSNIYGHTFIFAQHPDTGKKIVVPEEYV